MSLRLNEKPIVRAVFEAIPADEVPLIAARFPVDFLSVSLHTTCSRLCSPSQSSVCNGRRSGTRARAR